ncbi:MAG: Circadian clock protein KaiC, partial [uncultured Frankineae bacterium]
DRRRCRHDRSRARRRREHHGRPHRPGRGRPPPRRGRAPGRRVDPQGGHRHPGLRPRVDGRSARAPGDGRGGAGGQRQDGVRRAVPRRGRAQGAARRLRHARGAGRRPAGQPAHPRLGRRGLGGCGRLALRRRLPAGPRGRTPGAPAVQHGDPCRADRARRRRDRRRAPGPGQPQRGAVPAGGRRRRAPAAAEPDRVAAPPGPDGRAHRGDARRPGRDAVPLRRGGVRRRQRRAAAQRPRGGLPPAHARGAQDARRHAPQGRRRLHDRAGSGAGRAARHRAAPVTQRPRPAGVLRQRRAGPAHPRRADARLQHAAVRADRHGQDAARDAVRRGRRRRGRAGPARRLRGDPGAGPPQRPGDGSRLRGVRAGRAAAHRLALPGGGLPRRPPRRGPRPRRAAAAGAPRDRQPVGAGAARVDARLPRVRHRGHVLRQDGRPGLARDRRLTSPRRGDVGHGEPHLGSHRRDRRAASRRAPQRAQAGHPRAQDARQQPRPLHPRARHRRGRPGRRRALHGGDRHPVRPVPRQRL